MQREVTFEFSYAAVKPIAARVVTRYLRGWTPVMGLGLGAGVLLFFVPMAETPRTLFVKSLPVLVLFLFAILWAITLYSIKKNWAASDKRQFTFGVSYDGF